MWILISWLLKKPADLDLHCFQLSFYLSGKFTFDIKTFLWTSTLLVFTFPWASIKCCYFHTPRALSFSNNFLIFAPSPHTCAPKMNKIKNPLGPQIIICKDIHREILNLNFYWLCVTILRLLLNKVSQFHLFPRFHSNFTLFNPF